MRKLSAACLMILCFLTAASAEAAGSSKLRTRSPLKKGAFRERSSFSPKPKARPKIILASNENVELPEQTYHSPQATIQRPRLLRRRQDKNNFAIELLGRGGIYSVNYDRLVRRSVSLGAGFSYLGVKAKAGDLVNANASLIMVPLYANLYFNSSPHHRLLGTGGVTIAYAQIEIGSGIGDKVGQIEGMPFGIDTTANGSAILPIPVAGLGYEYRSSGGILARMTLYGLMVGVPIPWAGFSTGTHF